VPPVPDGPSWVVAIVCGASGVGKTTVATALAARHGVPLAEADDLVTAVKALTTAEQQPILHYWDTRPEARAWSVDEIVDLHLQVAAVMAPAFRAVAADHVEFGARVVFEGDYLLPDLLTGLGDAVRAVVLEEPDEDQIVAGLLDREPEAGPQRRRAQVSVRLGQRLLDRARRAGVPVVPARPWEDGLDRVDAALDAAAR
jgi:2-phosphoglycerate kinase